jgi:hypothetical protein
VTIRTEVRSLEAVRGACARLKLAEPVEGEAQIFSACRKGILVRFKDWQFPIVCDLSNGQVEFDNFEGQWGDPNHFDEFLQLYAVEAATLEARKRGYSVVEQNLDDGSIKLTIGMPGEAR